MQIENDKINRGLGKLVKKSWKQITFFSEFDQGNAGSVYPGELMSKGSLFSTK